MNKTKKISIPIILLLFILSQLILRAENKTQKDSDEIYEGPKVLMFNLGYGSLDLSAGAGFRYSIPSLPIGVGLSICLSGFNTTMPGYIYADPGHPMPTKGIEKTTFPRIMLGADAVIYYDLSEKISLFGTLGFYMQSDSILYKENSSGTYYRSSDTRAQFVTNSGMSYGLGIQYFITDAIEVGLAYQSKMGIYGQIGYAWY